MTYDPKEDIKRFFKILEVKEESDEGRVFSPTYISCCRAITCGELSELLKRLKEYSNE